MTTRRSKAVGRSTLAVLALLTATGCGSGAGGTSAEATAQCVENTCTVTYPAKARNNQASSGGGPAQVLGVKTQLFSISTGQATFRIADQQVDIKAGQKKAAGPLSIEALELTDTSVVLRYTKR